MARKVAMRLRVAGHDFRSRASPDVVSRLCRRMARVNAEQIAARRQNVGAPARRRAARTGLDEATGERIDKRASLGSGARFARGIAVGAREDVQAVADAHFLEIAHPGVETRQRLAEIGVAGHAAFLRKAASLGFVQNGAGDELRAARIERRSGGIFVEKRFNVRRRVEELSIDKRRRQMADRHGADAAFGLRSFTGIVDDERDR